MDSKTEAALLNLMLVTMHHQTVLQKLANPTFPAVAGQDINELLSKTESYIQKTIGILLPEVKTDGK